MHNNFIIYHPAVSFIYFVVVIMLSIIIMNPIFLGISLFCACIYAVYLKGGQAAKFGFSLVIPLLFLSIIINPLVNHRGATILFDWPFNIGPATLESMLYGFTTGLMVSSVIIWFIGFNAILTSDKLTFLFGRMLPGSSLVFVMILRFIPRYREQIKKINEAQQSIGMGINEGNLATKIRNGSRILSIMFTWALENAVQTADSMRARGYGLKNRTTYMIYHFTFYDKVMLLIIIIFTAGIVYIMATGKMDAEFFPFFEFAFANQSNNAQFMFVCGCLCFAFLALMPMILGIKETLHWHKLKMAER